MANYANLVTKYSADIRQYGLSFALFEEILAGDTISTIQSVTAAPSGINIGIPAISGSAVDVILGGGTSGTYYTVSATVVTSSNAVLVGSFVVYLQ